MIAHTLAKLVPSFKLPVIFFLNNLPISLEEDWFRDFIYIIVAILILKLKD